MLQILSTDAVAPRERLALWTDLICDVYVQLDCDATVHRAFQGEPCSAAHWIWTQRLDAIKRDLADPALHHRSVSDIAFSWGFNDAAHFSRVFKERFRVTPKEFRQGLGR